jgi:uncharacterized DUF497 family protein
MQFEWDQRKAAANLRKHGVAFIDAIAVFSDPLACIFPDPDHSEDEQRELIVGYDGIARLLFVSFIERNGNIRIISARRATTTEARTHEKYLK